MFQNIGRKIQVLAEVCACIGILASIIWGLVVAVGQDAFLLGFVIIVLGTLLSWASCFLLYGFGEIIIQLEAQNRIAARTFNLLYQQNHPQNIHDATKCLQYATDYNPNAAMDDLGYFTAEE